MIGIDFNLSLNFGQNTFINPLKGLANAYWTDSFLTTGRLSSQKTVRQMCSKIQRQLSDKNFFLFRSVPLHGICPNNVSSEPSRHRDLPASNEAKTLPLRNTRKCLTYHCGESKRKSGLENLRRLRTGLDKQGTETLCQRRLRLSTGTRCLCSGFNHHRLMSNTISMGKISQTQSRHQGSYAYGPKRLYTHFYSHYRRMCPRCKYPRRTHFGAWCNLYNGSRLSRLCSSLYIHSKPFNFYYKSKKQFQLFSPLLSQCRQNNRLAMRPDDTAQRLLCFTGLPCCTSSNRLLRHRNKPKVHISNKQFRAAGFNNCTALQVSLADRNFLQMDQAIPANQNIFWHHRECGEDSNLDCHQRLRFGGNCQKGTENRTEFGRNLANSQHCTFRESLYYTSTYEKCFAKWKFSIS